MLRTRASAPKATQEVTVDNVSESRCPLHDTDITYLFSKVALKYSLSVTSLQTLHAVFSHVVSNEKKGLQHQLKSFPLSGVI